MGQTFEAALSLFTHYAPPPLLFFSFFTFLFSASSVFLPASHFSLVVSVALGQFSLLVCFVVSCCCWVSSSSSSPITPYSPAISFQQSPYYHSQTRLRCWSSLLMFKYPE